MYATQDTTNSRHEFLRWAFVRGLGLVYLIAFVSLWFELGGLIGSQGILPAKDFLDLVAQALHPPSCYWKVPTVFWLNADDLSLSAGVVVGSIASLCLLFGLVPLAASILCWLLYLSFVSVGQDFLSFQWDALLIEAGFLALFLSPWTLIDKRTTPTGQRTAIFMWLLRWLLFKLMLLSGLVKLLSGDQTWWQLTALQYHYETQPLPTPLGWLAHQLPPAFDSFSAACMFAIELLVPFMMFMGRRPRHVAAALTVSLQIMIALTGNYTFFNLLTILLCISLLDDLKVPKLQIRGWALAPVIVAGLLLSVSIIEIATIFNPVPQILRSPLAVARAFRVVNTYGLFAVMTKERPEITVQGSDDGVTWKDYVFRFKPGPLDRPPPVVAPFQPRLDWQMWFAALGPVEQSPWFVRFVEKLLEAKQPVLALLEKNPFPDKPPTYIRALTSNYHFTDFDQKSKSNNWWRSDEPSAYLRPARLGHTVSE